MKRINIFRLSALFTLLVVTFGLLFAVNAPMQINMEKTVSAQLYFVDGLTHDLPTASNRAANESRLDEAEKTVYFRLQSDSAVSTDTCAYIVPAFAPLARTEGRGSQREDSGESG